jgi:SAM-dependent methyltransferase
MGPNHTHSEMAYQAERATQLGDVTATPDYVIDRYRRCTHWRLFPKEFMFRRLHDIGLTDKKVLEFGCGEGVISTQLARLGARVTAVDISPELIACAERRTELDGVRDRIEFVVGDVMTTPLEKNRFDVLVCHAVIHHVDMQFVPKLLASLKPGGLAVMVEPIAFSRSLQRLRDLLPVEKDVSPDERQLSKAEVDTIARLLVDTEVTFFNLFGRLSRLLPHCNRIDRGHPLTKAALISLHRFDRLLLALCPFVARWCGVVAIVGHRSAGSRSQAQARSAGAPTDPAAAWPR